MILRQYSNTESKKVLTLNRAFFRLYNNGDFHTVIDWLKSEQERLSKENMIVEDIQFKRNQGALQALFDIIDMSDRGKAQKIVEKLEE